MTREEAVARIKDHIEVHRCHERNAVKIFEALDMAIKALAQPEQRWIPVTLETLPNRSSVVVVCGKKGTWDFGMYRGWSGNIHSWQWKNNTIKDVYWWMYKTDALPEPYREEGGE